MAKQSGRCWAMQREGGGEGWGGVRHEMAGMVESKCQ